MEKLKREKKGSSKGVEEERCKKNISRWLNPRWPPKKFRTQIFWYTQKKLWTQIFFGLKLCSDPIFFPDLNFFRTQIFFRTQFNLDVRVSFFSIMQNSGGNLSSKFIGKSKSRYQVWPSSAQLVSSFFLFFFYAFCFFPISGILRKLIFFQPSYLGITRRNIKKSFF